jgi:hypothetical protein
MGNQGRFLSQSMMGCSASYLYQNVAQMWTPRGRVAHPLAFGIAKRAVFDEWRVSELCIV